jgi:hypothetical protein
LSAVEVLNISLAHLAGGVLDSRILSFSTAGVSPLASINALPALTGLITHKGSNIKSAHIPNVLSTTFIDQSSFFQSIASNFLEKLVSVLPRITSIESCCALSNSLAAFLAATDIDISFVISGFNKRPIALPTPSNSSAATPPVFNNCFPTHLNTVHETDGHSFLACSFALILFTLSIVA